MKKAALAIVLLLALLLLCSCKEKEQNDMGSTGNKTVTFINGVKEADLWILPKTEKNLKTTVWGTATVSKIKAGESRQAPLCEPGDGGLYLIRMIDSDSFYYSANDVKLDAGWTLQVKENDAHEVTAEVKDENGDVKNSYEVFSARL